MCVCNVELFGGEAVVHVLRTHPRIYINGIMISSAHFIAARQFLGTP